MIRTVITAEKNIITLPLPDSYIGKQVEVIAFTINNSKKRSVLQKKKVSFNAVKLDTIGYKFNRNEANER